MRSPKAAAMMAMMYGYSQAHLPKMVIKHKPRNNKHYSDQECARRRGTMQHMNQVRIDARTKRQPG